MQALANRITSFFIAQNLLDEERRPWYVYALENKLGQALTLLFTFAAGCALGRPLQPLLVLVAAMFLRQRAGGWHAPSPWLCQFLSVGLAAVGCLAGQGCADRLPLLWLAALLAAAGWLVFWLAPAAPTNLPFTPAEWAANRRLARRRFLLAAAAAAALQAVFPFRPYGLCVAAGAFLAATSVLAQTIKQEVDRNGKAEGKGE